MAKSNAGRKTLLTKKKQAEICQYISEGNTITDACILSGVAMSTVMDWRRKGREEEKEIKKKGRLKSKKYKYLEFLEATKKAEIGFKAHHIKKIDDESEKNWIASAWLLERKFYKEFGKKYNVDAKIKAKIKASGKIDMMELHRKADEQIKELERERKKREK
jgi:hypothetical protein